ncbi:hypothetical protein JTE90_001053 [Oedothorax gibbosus]|uniref:Tumor protein D52 n=1 Tax=Oedothorax gibbosus TaxID=931172 RepID=A0AAV6UGI7_9ARAC|nr:hypothetical protein JTE90_001053 [Oedothorax gibbosus]
MSHQNNEGLLSSASKDSFYDTSEEAFSLAADNSAQDLSQMTPEGKAQAIEDWTRELEKTEEEINTLRQVLSSKIRRMQDLKRKLGITVWKEFRDDMEQGIKNIQESTAQSSTFKNIEEKVGTAYTNVKSKVSGSSAKITDASGISGEPLIESNGSQIPAQTS